MKNAPKSIFLQLCEDVEATDWNEIHPECVSWCTERINENDLEYVAAGSLPDLDEYGLFESIKLLSRTEKDFLEFLNKAERRANQEYSLVLNPNSWYHLFKKCLVEWAKGNDY